MRRPRPTFRAWLTARRRDQTMVGDVARDVLADEELKGVHLNADRLRGWLDDAGACAGAYQALDRAQREYDEEGR